MICGCAVDVQRRAECGAADWLRKKNGAHQKLLRCAPFVVLVRTKTSDGAQGGELGWAGLDRICMSNRIKGA